MQHGVQFKCGVRSKIKQGLALLKKDLINGPYHCFGYHSNCSPDFCQAARSTHADTSSNPPVENEESTTESTSDNDYIHGKSVQ